MYLLKVFAEVGELPLPARGPGQGGDRGEGGQQSRAHRDFFLSAGIT